MEFEILENSADFKPSDMDEIMNGLDRLGYGAKRSLRAAARDIQGVAHL